jgi:C4-dicarboxylate-specific signal transduction histidine kinase
VATLKSGELRGGNIDVRVELSDDLGIITADSGQIEQVLINLVNNAADALAHQPAARLNIRAEVINGKTQVQVIDNGPGIDKDQLDKIFVPFFTTKSTGTGIGLSLSGRSCACTTALSASPPLPATQPSLLNSRY